MAKGGVACQIRWAAEVRRWRLAGAGGGGLCMGGGVVGGGQARRSWDEREVGNGVGGLGSFSISRNMRRLYINL